MERGILKKAALRLLCVGERQTDWLVILFGAFLAVSPDFDFFFVFPA